MTHEQRVALRERRYTYYEMLAYGQFYHEHRNENSPEKLLVAFLKWKALEGEITVTARKLLIVEEVVCRYYGLALADVRGKRRYAELVRARQVIAHCSIKYASQNNVTQCIGMYRNNVQYGKTKCSTLMETEPVLRREVAEIQGRIDVLINELNEKIKLQINDNNEGNIERNGNVADVPDTAPVNDRNN